MSGSDLAGGLNAGGWIFLITACGGIAAVTAYCFYRLLETRDRGK